MPFLKNFQNSKKKCYGTFFSAKFSGFGKMILNMIRVYFKKMLNGKKLKIEFLGHFQKFLEIKKHIDHGTFFSGKFSGKFEKMIVKTTRVYFLKKCQLSAY